MTFIRGCFWLFLIVFRFAAAAVAAATIQLRLWPQLQTQLLSGCEWPIVTGAWIAASHGSHKAGCGPSSESWPIKGGDGVSAD